MTWQPDTYATVHASLDESELLPEVEGYLAQCPVSLQFVPWFELVDIRHIAPPLIDGGSFVATGVIEMWIKRGLLYQGQPLTRRTFAEILGAPVEHLATIITHAPPTLEQIKTAARVKVDAAAEDQRLRYITPGSGQAMVYDQKNAEAKKYFDIIALGGTPDPADYVILAAEAQAKGETIMEVATLVRQTAMAWLPIAATIEARRMAAKKAIDHASTAEEVLTATQIDWEN